MRFALRSRFIGTVVVLAGLLAVPHAQSSVDGNWSLLFDTPMGQLDASATFKTEGEELTGTMDSQAGSTSFKGTAKGNSIAFLMNVPGPSGDMSIQMNADVEGDTLKGTFSFSEGTGTWTGKRVK